MKKISIENVNRKKVINENELAVDNYRVPFVSASVKTKGSWIVAYVAGNKKDDVQDITFSATKKYENKPFVTGGFSYNVRNGAVDMGSVAFELNERFMGAEGFSKLNHRARDIKMAIVNLVNTFGFINAVEEYNSAHAATQTVSTRRNAADSSRKFTPSDDEYVPEIRKDVKYEPADTTDEVASSNRTFEHHTDAWSVRGHWRRLGGGRRTWVKAYEKSWND